MGRTLDRIYNYVANKGDKIQSNLTRIGSYIANLGNDQVLEAVPAFGEEIPINYLHGRSVVDWVAEKQGLKPSVDSRAGNKRTIRTDPTADRSYAAWQVRLKAPINVPQAKSRRAWD